MLTILFPMGGTGQRFTEAGYHMPKPLLTVGNKRLIQWALTSVQQLTGQYAFILSADSSTSPIWPTMVPEGNWHVLNQPTTGPLQTILKTHEEAFNFIPAHEELLVCDCDSFLSPTELQEAITLFRQVKADGGFTVRRTQDPNCAYADLGSDWWVVSTREKDPYTPWSATGPYWFKSGQIFLEAAQKAARAQQTSIAPVYNFLKKVKAFPVSTFRHLGTPKEFEEFKQELEQLQLT